MDNAEVPQAVARVANPDRRRREWPGMRRQPDIDEDYVPDRQYIAAQRRQALH